MQTLIQTEKATADSLQRDRSALASKLLKALQALAKECVPHNCGGFTTDDMQWQMGTAFLDHQELNDALDELQSAKIIRYAGYDEDDAIGHCYEIR